MFLSMSFITEQSYSFNPALHKLQSDTLPPHSHCFHGWSSTGNGPSGLAMHPFSCQKYQMILYAIHYYLLTAQKPSSCCKHCPCTCLQVPVAFWLLLISALILAVSLPISSNWLQMLDLQYVGYHTTVVMPVCVTPVICCRDGTRLGPCE
jgi:hypothetical protein